MDNSTKQMIKYGAMALAAYFVYDWLNSSGLWAQWFGTSTAVPLTASMPATVPVATVATPAASPSQSLPPSGVSQSFMSPGGVPAPIPVPSLAGYEDAYDGWVN